MVVCAVYEFFKFFIFLRSAVGTQHNTLTDTGELTGVEWFFRGAHMNGEVKSRLPVEPDGLWLFTANELVSGEGA